MLRRGPRPDPLDALRAGDALLRSIQPVVSGIGTFWGPGYPWWFRARFDYAERRLYVHCRNTGALWAVSRKGHPEQLDSLRTAAGQR